MHNIDLAAAGMVIIGQTLFTFYLLRHEKLKRIKFVFAGLLVVGCLLQMPAETRISALHYVERQVHNTLHHA